MADEVTDQLGRPIADQRALLRILTSHRVEFLIAGGVAVIAYGYLRLTVDLDIIPSPRVANLRALAEALRDMNASAVKSGGEPLPLNLANAEGLAVGNYFLITDHGALDLLNGPHPDLKRYARLDAASIEVSVSGHIVKLVSKADLIAMKREAGRPKDLRDIAALTEVERNP